LKIPFESRLVCVLLLVLLAGCTHGQAASTTEVSAFTRTVTTTAVSSATVTSTTVVESGGSQTPPPGMPSIPVLDPITGYGDFSDESYALVDWFAVTALEVQCANDQGIPVTVMAPGDGIDFRSVALDQQVMASAVVRACEAGLNLPAYEQATKEQLARLYEDLLDTKSCLEAEGYVVDEPPSVDRFVENYYEGVWDPYSSVSLRVGSEAEWNRVQAACPYPRIRQ